MARTGKSKSTHGWLAAGNIAGPSDRALSPLASAVSPEIFNHTGCYTHAIESVRGGAKQLCTETKDKLSVLICNAGVMSLPFTATKDGSEPHFGKKLMG